MLDLKHIEAMWQTLNEYIPIRREGEVIPQGFSIQWWHGPVLRYREGDEIVEFNSPVFESDEFHASWDSAVKRAKVR